MKSLPLILTLLAALVSIDCQAKACENYQLEQVAEGLGIPWGMALIGPNKLLVTERGGKLLQLDLTTGKQTNIKGLPPIYAKGQGGLLDIQLGPKTDSGSSSKQQWLYITYAKPVDGQGRTTIARALLRGKELVNWQDLLVTESATDTGRHFGSRIAFDDKGHLYFSIGDRGHRPNGQDLTTHAGSILRLNLDGSVPRDNPFASATNKSNENALPEIYSYGHRNPQGLTYDVKSQRLWSIEHGPRGGDEINLIKAGGNYGWPVVSFGKEYWGPISVGDGTFKEGMEPPVKVYTPSIAPSSLLVYSGHAFIEWQGDLLSGALKLTHLNRVVLDGERATSELRLLTEFNERIRQVIEDEHGYLLISTDSGSIYRLKPCGV
ncbi:PQQ-dependent sugar dehydrogenase [Shewanella canadensis]|uniref:PQQ-dependent sugar dehydrogenase n=1 Tax=Shewanella canadensis TaxID=271096 RepID=A0A3S0KUI4_9GAMM|nr:PQQ-dependent sugar dehydrogenase [Shewanella canadensis]RTR38778.1 PQQ-dependent sugar dehydrogenase [Shewanella canadensis]